MSSLYGNIVDGFQVQRAVIAHLQNWRLTYFAEIERQQEIEPRSIPDIRSWTTTPQEPHRWAEDQLPAVLCVNARLQAEPEEDGDGSVAARWMIGIGVIAEAAEQEQADRLAKLQFAALRAIMLQHASLGGFAEGVEWLSESYDMIDIERRRTLGTAYGLFGVGVPDVVDTTGGVQEPPEDPYEEFEPTTIETVDRPEVVKT